MKPEAIERLLEKHHSSGIVLDTNLFILLIVGDTDTRLIGQFKRTQKYTVEDYELTRDLLSSFKVVFTTLGILTEVDNLSRQIREDRLSPILERFEELVRSMEERKSGAVELLKHPKFQRFGLTDVGIAELAQHHLILTDDFPLANYLESEGHSVLNFNHIRTLRWDLN